MSLRKLKHHEQKLLKKVDFLQWKSDQVRIPCLLGVSFEVVLVVEWGMFVFGGLGCMSIGRPRR